MASINKKLTQREKAAILLISLGKDYCAQVFKHLKNDEIEQLTLDITNIRRIEPETRDLVIKEFHELCLAHSYFSEGGIDYATEVLNKALGQQRAMELISKLTSSLQVIPFEFLRKIDPSQLYHFIKNEHPQTIALVFSYLEPNIAAAILNSLPQERQVDVVSRISKMGRTSPEYIKEVERIFERKLSNVSMSDYTTIGGIDSIVTILNSVDRGTEKNILENLEMQDADLAEEIRRRMFVFEDIVKLSSIAIQRVLREVDNNDLTVALKGAAKDVTDIIFQNMSKRLQDMIREDMELMGPIRIRDVEASQQKIVGIIRTLEDSAEIIIVRGQEDALVG